MYILAVLKALAAGLVAFNADQAARRKRRRAFRAAVRDDRRN